MWLPSRSPRQSFIDRAIDMVGTRYGQEHGGRMRAAMTAAALLAACAAPRGDTEAAFIDPRSSTLVMRAEVLARMRSADIVLLGEVHDHPGLHAHRAALLDAYLSSTGADRPVVLVLEHFDLRDDAQLRAAQRAAPQTPSQWVTAAAPRSRLGGGWDWTVIAPALQVAARHSTEVRAANRSASELMADTHAVPVALAAPAQTRLLDILFDGHCGLLSRAAVVPMARMQQLRDDAMAGVLLSARAGGAQPILLAGNGHVRRDFGVPVALAARGAPVPSVLVIGFVEGGTAAAPAAASRADDAHAYDVLLQLPPHPRPDPCVALRERMQRSPSAAGARP